jgi:hypothetical protein
MFYYIPNKTCADIDVVGVQLCEFYTIAPLRD